MTADHITGDKNYKNFYDRTSPRALEYVSYSSIIKIHFYFIKTHNTYL